MAKRFSKKYGNKGWAFNYLQSESYVKMPVSCYIPTSLPPEPLSILYYLQELDNKRPVESLWRVKYMPSPSYPVSVVLFQLHGGIVSPMQVLPTPFSTMHILNTWILTTETILVLDACFWDSDVGMFRRWQASWHNFRIAGSWKLIPCFRTF